MFASLNGENLTELGITAFGARKKMLMAISTLNAHRIDRMPTAATRLSLSPSSTSSSSASSVSAAKFSGSAAPGAERRLSSDW